MTKINKEGWENIKLGEVITEYSKKNKADEDIPVYSVTNSAGFCREYFSKEVASQDKSTYKIVPYGCFAYNPSRINVGSIGLQEEEERVIVSPLYNVFSTSERIDNHFLLYFMKSKVALQIINAKATGSVRMNLRINMLKDFDFNLPPLPIQQHIVEELDEINAIISAKKQQLSKLDELAQSIFYKMFGDPVANEKGWEVKTIGEVCHLKSGDSKANNSPEGTLPYVKVGDMNLPGNEEYITCSSKYVDYESNKKAIFPIGTVIFPKRGGAILTNKKRLTKVEVCCDLNTMGVIPSEALLSKYLYVWFKLLDLGTVCSGSTILQLNNCDIAPLKIQLPPLPLQETFAARVSAIEDQKAAIAASIEKMQTLLDARMQEYFG